MGTALVGGKSKLILVDAGDPSNMIVTYTSVLATVNEMAVSGFQLYTVAGQTLTAYAISPIKTIPATVSVQVPHDPDVTIVAGSYSTPPAQIIPGVSYDTLVWNETLAFGARRLPTTWQLTVSNLAAGEVRPVTLAPP